MRALTCLIAVVLCVVASPAGAAPVAYAEAFDTLYRVDLAAGTASEVGSNGRIGVNSVNDVTGLSLSEDGSLYAVSDTLKLLLRLDKSSGVATAVGNLGLAGQGVGQYDSLDFGMAFGCDGNLWLSSATTGKLWSVDPATAETSPIGNTGHTITGLAVRDGVLYGAGTRHDNFLYRIDTQTGEAQAIGSYGASVPAWINSISMSFDADGTLWAVLNYIPPEPGTSDYPDWSDLATIDPQSGEITIIGPITGNAGLRGIGLRGFALGPSLCTAPSGPAPIGAPVDSRWALLLLGALLAGVAVGASRRQRARR